MTTVSVTATPEAVELIDRLRAKHGPLVFLQSGGCCDGSAPFCARRDDLPIGPNDVLLGTIGGAEFYIDRDQYERWREPQIVVDVAPEGGDSFSLEGAEEVHFVLAAPAESGSPQRMPVS
jgi:uncharacterized protein (DUF779 family)